MNYKTKTSKITDTLKLKIRNEFVQGMHTDSGKKIFTLDELIKKYKVAQSTIYRIARNENWKILKEQFEQEYQQQLNKDRIKNRAKESIKFDDNSISIAKALYSTVGVVMANNNIAITKGKKVLSPSQLNSLANAAITAQRLAKLALGEATDNIDATVNQNTDAFRRAMELLDTVEDQRRSQGDGATH